MPRYEFEEGSSKKFWEITLDGASFTTTYGRIGTEGQSSLKEWESVERAKKEHDKLVAEKVKKGYRLVGDGAPVEKPKSAAVFEDEGEDEAPPPVKTAKPATPAKPAASSKSEESGARYFELVEGTSSKFWEIRLDGAAFTTRYGRIGTNGQESMKEYDSPAKAKIEHDKLVAEKTKKGYVEK